jgi:hypothetical protein
MGSGWEIESSMHTPGKTPLRFTLVIHADTRDAIADAQHLQSKVFGHLNKALCKPATDAEPNQRNPMRIIKQLFFVTSSIMVLAIPALASVTVSSPANKEQVGSPFNLSATAANCSSEAVASMGYSLDSSSDTTVVDGVYIDTTVAAGDGAHTLHVKAWGDKGSSCVTDVAITVATAATGGAYIPSNATSNSNLQALSNWKATHDTGTVGDSRGTMSLVNSPSRSGNARKFVTSFTSDGGERYSVSFGDDTSATNFVYDAWVYFTSSSSSIGNLEMDMNQVMSNGQTVIYAFQCSGYSGAWDYTRNSGTVDQPRVDWVHSKAACNPRNWSIDTWHHVQISYSRTDSGMVTYNSVWFDDKEQVINVTVPSAFALGWGPCLVVNFQVDGFGPNATSTVYLDDMVVYRW